MPSRVAILSVATHSIFTPYETVRQAANRSENVGQARYDLASTVFNVRVRDAARKLVAMSAGVSPPTTEESYVIPQFGDWPFTFTRTDAVHVWTQGGYQVGRNPLRAFVFSEDSHLGCVAVASVSCKIGRR